jgi:hypothetical protein
MHLLDRFRSIFAIFGGNSTCSLLPPWSRYCEHYEVCGGWASKSGSTSCKPSATQSLGGLSELTSELVCARSLSPVNQLSGRFGNRYFENLNWKEEIPGECLCLRSVFKDNHCGQGVTDGWTSRKCVPNTWFCRWANNLTTCYFTVLQQSLANPK